MSEYEYCPGFKDYLNPSILIKNRYLAPVPVMLGKRRYLDTGLMLEAVPLALEYMARANDEGLFKDYSEVLDSTEIRNYIDNLFSGDIKVRSNRKGWSDKKFDVLMMIAELSDDDEYYFETLPIPNLHSLKIDGNYAKWRLNTWIGVHGRQYPLKYDEDNADLYEHLLDLKSRIDFVESDHNELHSKSSGHAFEAKWDEMYYEYDVPFAVGLSAAYVNLGLNKINQIRRDNRLTHFL